MPVCVCLTVFNVLVEQEPNRWQSTERRKMDCVQAAAIILMLGTHVWSIVSYDTPLFSAQTISLSPFYSSLVYSWKNASWHYFCIYTSIRFLFNRCSDCFTAASQREHQVIRLIFQNHAHFSLVVSGGLHSSSSFYLWDISRIIPKHLCCCSYIFSRAEYLKKQSTSVTVILFLLEYCHCSYLRWDNKCDYWVCVFLLACVYIMKSQFKQLFSTITGWEFRLKYGWFDQIWGIEESANVPGLQIACICMNVKIWSEILWGCIQTI